MKRGDHRQTLLLLTAAIIHYNNNYDGMYIGQFTYEYVALLINPCKWKVMVTIMCVCVCPRQNPSHTSLWCLGGNANMTGWHSFCDHYSIRF